MSERISGRHALRHLHNQDNTHDLAVFALLGFLSAGLHFLGYTGLRARHLHFERAASLAALARCSSLLPAFVRLEICTVLRTCDLLLVRNRSGQSEHGDEGARGDVSDQATMPRTGHDIDARHFFLSFA